LFLLSVFGELYGLTGYFLFHFNTLYPFFH
jgi:hypothetical protein